MPKRTKRKPAPRATPTTHERIRREEESALRRNLRAERRIQKLARQLDAAIRHRETALVELHAALGTYLCATPYKSPAEPALP
jgi:hypothetical protein